MSSPMKQYLIEKNLNQANYNQDLIKQGGYPCKYNISCPRWRPDMTLPVTIGFKGHPETNKVIEKSNNCTHGGGCACAVWRHDGRMA